MANCLQSAVTPVSAPPVCPEEEEIDLTNVPSCYHDLKLVFSKSKASYGLTFAQTV